MDEVLGRADMGSTLILNDRSWTPICWGRGWGGLAVQTHSTANANIRYRRPPKIYSPISLERYWPLLSWMCTNNEMRHSCKTYGLSVSIKYEENFVIKCVVQLVSVSIVSNALSNVLYVFFLYINRPAPSYHCKLFSVAHLRLTFSIMLPLVVHLLGLQGGLCCVTCAVLCWMSYVS